MAVVFCAIADAKLFAGANVATLVDASWTTFINEAESYINAVCRYNYSDNYAGLNDDVKKILELAAASHAAMTAIAYDQTGYTNAAAANLLNLNYARFNECMKLLATDEVRTFINNA